MNELKVSKLLSHGLRQIAVLRRLLIQYYLTSIISTPVRGTGETAGNPDRRDSLYQNNGHIRQCNQWMKRQLKLLIESQEWTHQSVQSVYKATAIEEGRPAVMIFFQDVSSMLQETIQTYNTMHWFSKDDDVDDGRWNTNTHIHTHRERARELELERELELHHLPIASLLAKSSLTSCSPRNSTVVDWQAIGIGKFGNFSAIYARLLYDSHPSSDN